MLSTLGVGGSESKIVRIANALGNSPLGAEIAYLNTPNTLLPKIDHAVAVTCLYRRGKYSFRSLRKLRSVIGTADRAVFAVNLYPSLYVVPALRSLPKGRGKAVCLINTVELKGKDFLLWPIFAPFLRRCDELVFGSEAQRAIWTEKYRLPFEHSLVLYNGVDEEYFRPHSSGDLDHNARQRLDIPSGALVVGSVGRLAPEKNFDLLISAISELNAHGRQAYLVLVGQGREQEKLERLASNHGISNRLRFPGLLDDVRPAIAAMDIFVLPSRAVETFSNAALEAMSMARPVVLSNIGGASEMVRHGESGFLFRIGDLRALVDLLTPLCDSAELRKRVGAAARQRVLSQFRFDSMLEGYKAIATGRRNYP